MSFHTLVIAAVQGFTRPHNGSLPDPVRGRPTASGDRRSRASSGRLPGCADSRGRATSYVLRDDVVVAEGLRHGTKEDLVEGRGGDGSVVHACLLGACGAGNRSKSGPGSRFQSNRVTRSAAASAAQNIRHIRELSRRNHLRAPTPDEHATSNFYVKPVIRRITIPAICSTKRAYKARAHSTKRFAVLTAPP